MTNVRHVNFPAVPTECSVSRGLFVKSWLATPSQAPPLPTAGNPLALRCERDDVMV